MRKRSAMAPFALAVIGAGVVLVAMASAIPASAQGLIPGGCNKGDQIAGDGACLRDGHQTGFSNLPAIPDGCSPGDEIAVNGNCQRNGVNTGHSNLPAGSQSGMTPGGCATGDQIGPSGVCMRDGRPTGHSAYSTAP